MYKHRAYMYKHRAYMYKQDNQGGQMLAMMQVCGVIMQFLHHDGRLTLWRTLMAHFVFIRNGE